MAVSILLCWPNWGPRPTTESLYIYLKKQQNRKTLAKWLRSRPFGMKFWLWKALDAPISAEPAVLADKNRK